MNKIIKYCTCTILAVWEKTASSTKNKIAIKTLYNTEKSISTWKESLPHIFSTSRSYMRKWGVGQVMLQPVHPLIRVARSRSYILHVFYFHVLNIGLEYAIIELQYKNHIFFASFAIALFNHIPRRTTYAKMYLITFL